MINQAGAPATFRILPVFVDGSPYANGVESRLKDRYAVVSALGVAGYMPESGEYIRYFKWDRKSESPLLVPIEWFLPESRTSGSQDRKHVLVMWLKDQDFSPHPLASLEELVNHLNSALGKHSATYQVLGPRSSGALSSMLSELKPRPPDQSAASKPVPLAKAASRQDFNALKGTTFYSSWATAADAFLFGDSQEGMTRPGVEQAFAEREISLIRTIDTDTALAEQLVEELQRRYIAFCIPPNVPKDCQPPHVALISEWDTLYGRALPRTFVAVAENMSKSADGRVDKQIDSDLQKLRADTWPQWVHHYSYLAGLDGELPPKGESKDTAGTQGKGKSGDTLSGAPASAEEAPTGRSQLDYVRRLAETLKREATEFQAIGVLGSDVYDKLMILQALRNDFPHAIFFTTDLDARMLHSGQTQWTRNLIVASHFGLNLHPDLQAPIPPFRDSYQTALFYSALQAVQYLLPLPLEHEEVRNSVTNVSYSIAGRPRLYEIGRHGAVDMSLDEPRDIPSIHAPRPDLDLATGKQRLPDAGKIGWAALVAGAVMLCAFLLNSEFLELFHARRHRNKLVFTFVLGIVMVGLLWWAMSDGAAGEPFSVTQGISVWPTTFIRLIACTLCMVFLWYASKRLRENDHTLTGRFGLLLSEPKPAILHPLIGIHYWRPHPGGDAS
ncbi:MAG: hypothetical protein M3M98_02450, partial [Nitrospirota bacterium]|nr:hypothetical protein [Nitrospirota bacterium]